VGAHRSRSRRSSNPSSRGQHFLAPRFAAELVQSFRIGPDEVVVEVGAGSGRLTRGLAEAAGLVLAIERDPSLAQRLLRAASSWPNVYVNQGDALETSWPNSPFRVVGNIPFGITTALLRRITGEYHAVRLDLVTQLETARKRAARRGSLLSVLWGTSWTFEVQRRIPARYFHPAPPVDAAWLVGRRRSSPMLAPAETEGFERLVRTGFMRAGAPLTRALGLGPSVIQAAGLAPDRRAVDLTVEDWVALFRHRHRPR
jgi:23S rRNA (adenine-N6)-dimethyltransferase